MAAELETSVEMMEEQERKSNEIYIHTIHARIHNKRHSMNAVFKQILTKQQTALTKTAYTLL